MGSIAFVFAGQGAQAPGMGRSLFEASSAARRVFEMADDLRPGTSRQCFEGTAEELARTLNTQPCLYCVDLAAARALMEAGVAPGLLAGFSLGELPAAAVAGVLSDEDGFRAVCDRARIMEDAAGAQPGAMAAVLGLPDEDVEALCDTYRTYYPANYNAPGQLVVSGSADEMDGFTEQVVKKGGKAIRLAVGGAFHSPYMAPAALAFEQALASYPLAAPRLPLYANRTGRPYQDDIRATLARQIMSPVRWRQSVEHMLAAGCRIFVEVGPGRTLSGLIRRMDRQAGLFNVQDAEGLLQTARALTKGNTDAQR